MSSRLPEMARELALRVGRSETDHMASWLGAVARTKGNPYRAEVRRFGGATALLGKEPGGTSLGPLFNRLLDFGDGDIDILDDAVSFYSERGLPCRIDLNPYAVGASTMRRLCAVGFSPFRYHDHLYGAPGVAEASDEIDVRAIGEADGPAWSEAWRSGFMESSGIEAADQERLAASTASLIGEPGWTFFLASCGNTPAAGAALYVENGVGSLALAGTRPEFRGRGYQAALIRARLNRAAELGCDLVAAQAALDASSHRNLQRAGLRVAYTRAFWLRPFSS